MQHKVGDYYVFQSGTYLNLLRQMKESGVTPLGLSEVMRALILANRGGGRTLANIIATSRIYTSDGIMTPQGKNIIGVITGEEVEDEDWAIWGHDKVKLINIFGLLDKLKPYTRYSEGSLLLDTNFYNSASGTILDFRGEGVKQFYSKTSAQRDYTIRHLFGNDGRLLSQLLDYVFRPSKQKSKKAQKTKSSHVKYPLEPKLLLFLPYASVVPALTPISVQHIDDKWFISSSDNSNMEAPALVLGKKSTKPLEELMS